MKDQIVFIDQFNHAASHKSLVRPIFHMVYSRFKVKSDIVLCRVRATKEAEKAEEEHTKGKSDKRRRKKGRQEKRKRRERGRKERARREESGKGRGEKRGEEKKRIGKEKRKGKKVKG